MLELERYLKLDEQAIKAANLCEHFSDTDLRRIGERVYAGFVMDRDSRSLWYSRTEAAMNLAMQVVKAKSFPWPNASNVIFPLVTIAALQFHSRAYPEIIQNGEVVKCKVGPNASSEDLGRAYRVGRYMSYQLTEEDSAWEEQHDRLLLNIPIVGCAFKKSYFDPKVGHNVSELVLARDFVINYYAKDVHSARRKTHCIPIYRNDLYEKCEAEVYRDIREEGWFKGPAPQPADTSATGARDARQGTSPPTQDEAAPFSCLEQHVWLDLDGDGYEEPYIILIEETSHEVLRIVSRVDRIEDINRTVTGKMVSIQAGEFFTKYGFIPSPDGGIYDIGLGVLLGPLNESVNTIINQLVDAGTMAVTAGGFLGRGAKIRGGVYSFSPFEWKRLDSTGDDINKNIFPLPVREPNEVLFKLLSLLIDFTNRVSGATEMLAGENPGQNTKVGTTDAMVEQGLKIYAAIFKRIWRSMKEEFKKLYVLNAIYLPARKVTFSGVEALREDFLADPTHIAPVADPNIVSDKIRMAQADSLVQRASSVPGYDMQAVEKNWLRSRKVDAPESFYVGPEQTGPLPNIKLQIETAKTEREQLKLRHQSEMFLFEMEEQHQVNAAEISKLEAMATKLLAEAKGVDVTLQINAINSAVGAMKSHNDTLHARAKIILDSMEQGNANRSGAVRQLARPSSDQGAALPAPAGS